MHKNIDSIKKMKDQVTNLVFVLQELERILSVKIIEMDKWKDQDVSILDDISQYSIILNTLDKIKDKNGKLVEEKIIKLLSDSLRYY